MRLSKFTQKEVGRWLARQRAAHGLTQKDLAETLELQSGQFISNVESGRAPIPLSHLIRLIQRHDFQSEELIRLILENEKSFLSKNLTPYRRC